MSGRRARTIPCLVAALLAGSVVAGWGRPIWVDGPVLDLLVAARAAIPGGDHDAPLPVAVVALDARSLAAPELASYPRTFLAPVWATVLDATTTAGARAVGFDFLFAYSANRFTPGFDTPFLAALGRHRERVVLARSAATLPAPAFLAALLNDETALGLTEVSPDADGVYRRMPATLATSDGPRPTLAGALVRRAQGPAMPPEVVLAPRHHPERIPTYAVVDVLRCATQAPDALRAAFAGRIVLLGSTLPEEDRRVSSSRYLGPPRTAGPPLHPCGLRRLPASDADSPSVPGVFLAALAVEAVASGHVTRTAPPGVVAGLAAASGAAGAALALTLTPWATAGLVVATALALLAAATLALVRDLWLPLGAPLAALGLASVAAYVLRYLVEEGAHRRIQHAFSHYLSPAIVERLAADPSRLRLGGELREVTVMFADLSGFTAMSGTLPPEELTRLTNQYLAYVVEQVEATGGYVDKFIGDAVMAMWNAPAPDPRHAASAIRAALGAVARIRAEGDTARSRGERSYSVKIGLNSGPAVVGNVGTERRYNYTAVGETVNVASRLESVPGLYGCQIVVGPRTAELARDEILLRELDWIQVKGREAPLAVFEPLGERARATPDDVARAQCFAEALADYRARRFAEAAARWDKIATENSQPGRERTLADAGWPVGSARTMAERARRFAAAPPSASWDGVLRLTSK